MTKKAPIQTVANHPQWIKAVAKFNEMESKASEKRAEIAELENMLRINEDPERVTQAEVSRLLSDDVGEQHEEEAGKGMADLIAARRELNLFERAAKQVWTAMYGDGGPSMKTELSIEICRNAKEDFVALIQGLRDDVATVRGRLMEVEGFVGVLETGLVQLTGPIEWNRTHGLGNPRFDEAPINRLLKQLDFYLKLQRTGESRHMYDECRPL